MACSLGPGHSGNLGSGGAVCKGSQYGRGGGSSGSALLPAALCNRIRYEAGCLRFPPGFYHFLAGLLWATSLTSLSFHFFLATHHDLCQCTAVWICSKMKARHAVHSRCLMFAHLTCYLGPNSAWDHALRLNQAKRPKGPRGV